MKNKNQLTLISNLLHEATLQQIEWNSPLGVVRLAFQALRRARDGSRIESDVQLALEAVDSIGVGYDSRSIEKRPSEFVPGGALAKADLKQWRYAGFEANVSVNDPAREREVNTAALTEWLLGGPRSAARAPLRICLNFDFWTGFGLPAIQLSILFACEGVAITSEGVPLSLAEWEFQYSAWWKGWQEHWDQKKKGAGHSESAPEDFAIPLKEDPPPDTTYRPPPEPIVDFEPSETPNPLLVPISDWLEGIHARDWKRLSSAMTGWAASEDEQIRALETRYLSHDFGRWGYARAIDSWWIEGDRACVVLRGIEHQMPEGDDPATNVESVWTIALRLIESAWKIQTWQQGWPRYKSAPAVPHAKKPWIDRWKSGRIEGATRGLRGGRKRK